MSRLPGAVRYALVSGFCLALNITIIPLLTAYGLHYAVATFMAFCLIAVVGFALHCRWTFSVEGSLISFVRYVSTMAINLPLTVVLIGIWHDLAGLSVAAATTIATLILVIWNYVAVKWAVGGRFVGGWK